LLKQDLKPFVEISIVSLNDKTSTKREIFDNLITRFKKIKKCEVKLIENQENPILRLEYSDFDYFYDIYTREFTLYEYFIENYYKNQSIFDRILLPVESSTEKQDSNFYVVFKYRTNDKTPLRKNYQFTVWFAEKFKEEWFYEEIEDGFLHFYRKKEDFLNSNLNKCDPLELQQWLKNKNLKFTPEIMKELQKCIENKPT